MKTHTRPTKKDQTKKEAEKPDFWDWLIHGKGSVSEPWSTAQEVLQYESVKNEIQKVKKAFNTYHQNKEKRQLK